MTDAEVAEWLAATREHYSREAFPIRYSMILLHTQREETMANETNADRRARQRDALKAQLNGLTADADARKHLAEEMREAAREAPQVHRRVIEVFERLGVSWPAGYKP